MLDDMIDRLANLRSAPAWQPIPDSVRQSFSGAVPREPEGADAAYADFVNNVLPYPNGNLHPRYWGWVQGTGTPLAMLAEMLAAGLNPHMAGFNQAPALVEHQVIAWLIELMGFPPNATGLLVSGGTMASTLGLAVARHAKAGFDVRDEGLQGERPRLVFYGSTETHGWAKKAAEFLGVGRRSFRSVPVDDTCRINVAALASMISADRSNGLHPFCAIGTAGTVNTGATDDLRALAELCRVEDLWFHVDGAFGALAQLSRNLRSRVAGIEKADSIGFDLHKWMYLPFESACVLIRDGQEHVAAFASTAPYIEEQKRGVIAGGLPFADRGLELTRSFKALKVWLSLKAHGVSTFARLIEQNVAQAEYLAALIANHPDLELLAPVCLNVVCFRYAPNGRSAADLNAFNEEILLRIQEEGVAVPSSTILNGRFALRVAIVNHRSQRRDFDEFIDAVLRIGRDLSAAKRSDR
jgi:aromatic-L-amino-acid/L-tryptophan decarboxylase